MNPEIQKHFADALARLEKIKEKITDQTFKSPEFLEIRLLESMIKEQFPQGMKTNEDSLSTTR